MPLTNAQKPRRQTGETRVWFTGMGLLIGLSMVVLLLGLVLWQGLSVFWPNPIHNFVLKPEADGKAPAPLLAEITREQSRKLPGEDHERAEVQLFMGNRELFGQAYRFVERGSILSESPAAGVMVAERIENGDLIGFPVAIEDAAGARAQASGAELRKLLDEEVKAAGRLRIELMELEKGRIGGISRELKELESEARRVKRELAGEPAAMEAKLKEIEAQRMAKEAPTAQLMAEAAKRREQLQATKFVYRIADGTEHRIPVGDIVHFHFPNEMGYFSKLGHFFHSVWAFLSQDPREANTEGGIFPAIFGTFVMTIIMSLLVTPLGVIAAIYLREYAHQGPLVRSVRICVNNLAGVPSIVFGVFGVGFFIYGLGTFIDRGPKSAMETGRWLMWASGLLVFVFATLVVSIKKSSPIRPVHPIATAGWVIAVGMGIWLLNSCPYFHGIYPDSPEPVFGTGGILWASLTLALMTLPVVIVASEEALASVPRGAREAALACGASKWQTIQRVVLPSALPGIMTGVILSMARGAGEVAPLMLTGVVKLSPSLPLDGEFPFIHADRKFMHLGFHIYDLGFQSPDSDAARPMVFATTLFLILLVVIMNIAAIRLRNWLRDKYKASTF